MPRLLLVDDNPSIHKIAETLLATTDIALVCAESGAQALSLLDKGGAFDVAMLDISMLGMDGWELLATLRKREGTALMPVAMMAGVLDVVDPEKLRLAPIQGFLKKPVELRDLAERVRHLVDMPVLPPAPPPAPPPPAAFATSPGFHLADHPELLERLQQASGDILILGPEDLFPGEPTVKTTESSTQAEATPPQPEEAFPGFEETLDLEELDLDSLRGLTGGPGSAEEAPAKPEAAGLQDDPAEPGAAPLQDELGEPKGVALQNDLADPAMAAELMDFSAQDGLGQEPEPQVDTRAQEAALEIPDFAPGDADLYQPPTPPQAGRPPFEDLPDLFPAEAAAAPATPVDTEFLDWTDDSDSLLAELSSAPPPFDPGLLEAETIESNLISQLLDATPTSLTLEELQPEAAEDALARQVEAPTVPAQAFAEESAEPFLEEPDTAILPEPDTAIILESVPTPEFPAAVSPAASDQADPLAALLADPVLMERLTKAVVARLGDEILREIAWEVIPELADRIKKN